MARDINIKKIQDFVNWMKSRVEYCYFVFDPANPKTPKAVVVPTLDKFNEYQIEHEEVQDLTEDEKRLIRVRGKNIICELMAKDKISKGAGEIMLNEYFGISLKNTKTASELEESKVVYNFSNISDEEVKPYQTKERLSFKNTAIPENK